MALVQTKQTYTLTLEVSAPVYQQLANAAASSQQSPEAIAIQSINGNLPPSTADMPISMQTELLAMQSLPNEGLLAIAHSQISSETQQQHQTLLDKNSTGEILPEERGSLRALRQNVDQLMIRKGYAWAVLRWRGYRMPSLQALPLP